jgi:deoxyribodipyrimidine photolyase-related protein
LPRRIVDDVVALDLPHASTEGFIRQILGWREFVHRVHVATDGFRNGPGCDPAGAPSLLGADLPVPPAFWPPSWGGAPSGLRCLDSVVHDVWAEGYSHHITRLMVLANIGALLDVSPRALTDWFWVAYVDAYDWVVEPNVLGMGTFAVGDVMTTKPYIAGAAYIDRMSDFCGPCAFSPKKPASDGGCPLTPMYWAYLQRHEPALKGNERLKLPLASSRKRSDVDRASSERVYQITRRALQGGERLQPASFAVDAPGTSTT